MFMLLVSLLGNEIEVILRLTSDRLAWAITLAYSNVIIVTLFES
jgi:hypothetical protein